MLNSRSCLFSSISFLTHNMCQPTDVVEVYIFYLWLCLMDWLAFNANFSSISTVSWPATFGFRRNIIM